MCEEINFKLLLILILIVNYFSITQTSAVSSKSCEFSPDHSGNCLEKLNKSQNSDDVKKSSIFLSKLNNFIKEKKVLFNVFKNNDLNSSVYNIVENKTKSLSQMFSNFNLKPIEMRLKQSIYDFVVSLNISDDCFQSLLRIANDFKQFRFWPLEFFDATAKIPAGIRAGVMTSFGEYDECLAIKSPQTDEEDSGVIRGKYCLVRPYLSLNNMSEVMTDKSEESINQVKMLLTYNMFADKFYIFHFGLCIPSKCTRNDLHDFFNKVIYPATRIPIEVSKCDVITDSIILNEYQTVMLIILSSLVVFVLMCSLTSILMQYLTRKQMSLQKGKAFVFFEIIESFSLIEANKRLVSPLNNRLKIADLFLFLYIQSSISALHYEAIPGTGFVGYRAWKDTFIIDAMKNSKYFWLPLFQRSSIFMISGLIISFDFFGPKKRPISVWQYIKFAVEKYYRFIPRIIGPMLVLNILSIMGSGPNWHSGERVFITSCQHNYWQSLIFINNLEADPRDYCNHVSWYLSVIFQLQIIAPIFMVPFKYSPKLGYFLNMAFLPFACFATIAPKLMNGLKILPFEVSDVNSLTRLKYTSNRYLVYPDQYVSLFIIGIMFGYFLRNKHNFDKLVKKRLIRSLFAIVCISTFILSIAWSYNFKEMMKKHDELNLSLWFVFGKVFWSFGNIWIIYEVYSRKIGFIDKLLSTKGFNAITRLIFGLFLTSLMLIYYRNLTKTENTEISHWSQIQLLYVDFTMMIILAYLLYIFIEYPFINLLDVFKSHKQTEQLEKTSDYNYVYKIQSKQNDVEVNHDQ